jgi:hypothetical protein
MGSRYEIALLSIGIIILLIFFYYCKVQKQGYLTGAVSKQSSLTRYVNLMVRQISQIEI